MLEITDAESSDIETSSTNKYGQAKTQRWNRPKVKPSLKEMEKVPTPGSKRISQLEKNKEKTQVIYQLLL